MGETTTEIVTGAMPDATLQGIASKLNELSKTHGVSQYDPDKHVLASMFHSLTATTSTSSYNTISKKWTGLIVNLDKETSKLLETANLQGFRKEHSNLESVVNKCLLLFRIRILLEPNYIESHEMELLHYIQNPPETLTGFDLSDWVTAEARVADLKYKADIQKAKEEVTTMAANIAAGKKQIEETSKRYLQEIDVTLSKRSGELSNSFGAAKKSKCWGMLISALFCAVMLYSMYHFGFELRTSIGKLLFKTNTGMSNLSSVGNPNTISTIPWAVLFLMYWPYLVLEAFLFYLFRIGLQNFYAARDEALQFKIREALCKFLPAYVGFIEGKAIDLKEFAQIIFSPIVLRLGKPPQITDPLKDIASAISAVAKKKKGN